MKLSVGGRARARAVRARLGRLVLVAVLVGLFGADAGMAAKRAASTATGLQADSRVERVSAAIELYRALAKADGWPMLPDGANLGKGALDHRVPLLRRRLSLTGDFSEAASSDPLFDESLDLAVRRFQARHGLSVDGVVGPETRAALNVPVAARLAQLERNLPRLPVATSTAEPLQIVVNIAAAELELTQGGRAILRSRTIVGRRDRPTPELHSAIRWIQFNPSWTVPPRIATDELLPSAQHDPNYLARRGFRVFAGWSRDALELDPRRVDWSSAAARTYVLRQEPGPENPLGPVKFAFPNLFDVYLHGTSAPHLFGRAQRNLSHGCVRVEEALELAALLLGWSRERVDEAVSSGATTAVLLPRPVPIWIVYLTAWVDEDGVVQFRDDVDERDDETGNAAEARASAAIDGQ